MKSHDHTHRKRRVNLALIASDFQPPCASVPRSQLMVDHVFVKAPGFAGRRRGEAVPMSPEVPGLVARMHEDVSVEEAMLLPGEVNADVWCPQFMLSDHRPLTVRLKFPAD